MGTRAAANGVIGHIAKAVEKGECILFLGAGAHAKPPENSSYSYPEEQRPPIGEALSRKLADGCREKLNEYPNESDTNLQRVSLFFELENSRRLLVEAIQEAVEEKKEPSPALHALAKLDFPLVVTTNYDRLFERALVVAEKDPFPSVYSPTRQLAREYDRATPTPDHPFVWKIHGDLGNPDSIVVTDDDYIDFVLRMSDRDYDPVPRTFNYFFTKWTTLFVGYSLVDYNLRLLFKTLRWNLDKATIPEAYSVDLHPDPLIYAVWHNQERYVRFIAEDIWTFVPALYRAVRGKEMGEEMPESGA